MRASFALVCLLLSLAPSNSAPGPEPAHLLILKLEDSEKEGLLDAQNGKANIHNKIQFDDKELKIQLISDKETVENHPAITRASNDHHVVDITREASDFNELDTNPRALTILDMINNQEPDAEGRKCVKKTMMRRETVYEEVMTCDHTYDERCHTSYTTTYEPHQEEDCEEKFRKVCMISNEQKAVTEMVEECTTPLVPDCTKEGPEVCRTVYDTVCHTKRVGYEVEEQFPVCTTVNMTKCQDVTLGLITEQECEVWPVQQCEVEDRKVTHTQPRTECRKEPRELCAPGDCPLVEVIFKQTLSSVSMKPFLV